VTPAERIDLCANAGRLGIGLDDQAVGRLGRFVELLEIWNQRFHLTGDRDRGTLLQKHVVDSLSVVPELPPAGPVLDIGTGAGFPGIVIACIRPEQEIVLLEPRRRPTSFLLEVVRTVGLPKVRVVEARAEDVARDPALAGRMALVLSRAVKLEQVLGMAPPFLRGTDGVLISMQSRSLSEQTARERAASVGMELLRIRDYQLPGGESRRLLFFGLQPKQAEQ